MQDPIDPNIIADVDLEHWFKCHPSREGQIARNELLCSQGLTLARLIYELTPPGRDQSEAIHRLREVILIANAAIACEHEVQSAYYARKVRT